MPSSAAAVAHVAGLLRVRSQLAEEFIDYLAGPDPARPAGLVGDLDVLPFFLKEQNRWLTIRESFIEPVVLTERSARAARRPERAVDGDGERGASETAGLEEMARRFYELDRRQDENEAVGWWDFVDVLSEPTVILGAPGSGKSCATRYTVLKWAEQAAEKLRAEAVLPEAVQVPAWITATDLGRVTAIDVAGAGPVEKAHLIDGAEAMLAAHAARAGRISERLRAFLRSALLAGRVSVVVDSLDEVPADAVLRRRLKQRLQALAEMGTHLIISCRTKDWHQLRDLVPMRRTVEHEPAQTAEFAPLQAREHREYARRLFSQDPTQRAAFERRLAAPGFIRKACTTPLLLTYTALLHADGTLRGATDLADLYGCILRGIVTARWRSESAPTWTTDDDVCEAVLRHIAAMAWQLFEACPEANHFTSSEAAAAFEQAGAAPSVPGSDNGSGGALTATSLLHDLLRAGLIVPAAASTGGEIARSFAHRTFLEFLAAWHVYLDYRRTRQWPGPSAPPPDWNRRRSGNSLLHWLVEEHKPFHFAPAWLQFFTFSAALLGDATPLIEPLDREPESIFLRMFGLQCHFLAVATGTDGILAAKLAERWRIGRARSAWEHTFEGLYCAYGACLARHPAARAQLFDRFEAALDPKHEADPAQRAHTVRTLGRLDAIEMLPVLERALDPTQEPHPTVRLAVVAALLGLGGPESILLLERAFQSEDETDTAVRLSIAEALAELGVPGPLAQLLSEAVGYLDSNETRVAMQSNPERPHHAVPPEEIPHAGPALSLHREPWRGPVIIRGAIAQAQQLANFFLRYFEHALVNDGRLPPAGIETALDLERDTEMRRYVEEAFERIAGPGALCLLMRALDPRREGDVAVRRFAAKAIFTIAMSNSKPSGPGNPLTDWVYAIAYSEEHVHNSVTRSLDRLTGPQALNFLLHAIDPSTAARHEREGWAWALRYLMDAIDPTRESDAAVRRYAADVAWSIAVRHAEAIRPGHALADWFHKLPRWAKLRQNR